jgi:high-affinity K+ transport system ATPase subunit B
VVTRYKEAGNMVDLTQPDQLEIVFRQALLMTRGSLD